MKTKAHQYFVTILENCNYFLNTYREIGVEKNNNSKRGESKYGWHQMELFLLQKAHSTFQLSSVEKAFQTMLFMSLAKQSTTWFSTDADSKCNLIFTFQPDAYKMSYGFFRWLAPRIDLQTRIPWLRQFSTCFSLMTMQIQFNLVLAEMGELLKWSWYSRKNDWCLHGRPLLELSMFHRMGRWLKALGHTWI